MRRGKLSFMVMRGRLLLALLLCALAAGAVWMERGRLASHAGTFLVDADPVRRAALIFLLNGDLDTRPPAAALFWKQGVAPRIAIARSESSRATQLGIVPNVTGVAIAMLEKLGVGRQNIIELPFPGGVTSTRDEAIALHEYVRANGVSSLAVVTSEIHTRRAKWLFRRVFHDVPVEISFLAVPDRRFRADRWWVTESGFLGVFNEYLKLVYYHWRY